MGILLQGCGYQFIGRQADAFVIDVHPAIAGAEGDLLGSVGMAIKPRFSDQKFQTASQFVADQIDRVTDVFQAFGLVGHALRYTRWPAIGAVHRAHLFGPFASSHARFGGSDGRFHHVASFARGGAKIGQGGLHCCVIAIGPPCVQSVDLFLFYGRINDHDATVFGLQR